MDPKGATEPVAECRRPGDKLAIGRIRRTARQTRPRFRSTSEIIDASLVILHFLKNEKYRITVVTVVDPFSDEQTRTLVNLEQRYQVWMEAEQALHAMPYTLARKEVKGRSYLYEIIDRKGNGRSLGPWSPEHETRFDAYQEEKAAAKLRRDRSRVALIETCRLYRALRLPLLSSEAGREALDGNACLMPALATPQARLPGRPSDLAILRIEIGSWEAPLLRTGVNHRRVGAATI